MRCIQVFSKQHGKRGWEGRRTRGAPEKKEPTLIKGLTLTGTGVPLCYLITPLQIPKAE